MAGPAVLESIDPFRNAKFPIHLGQSFGVNDEPQHQYSSIQYNHKPVQVSSTRTTTLVKSAGGPDSYDLVIDDEETPDIHKKYHYHGRRASTSTSCVLVFDPAKQAFALERLSAAYALNLTSTPDEPDNAKLQQQFPQLELSGSDDEVSLTADDAPDPSNPFDHRHFLTSGASPPSMAPTPRAQSPAPPPVRHVPEPAKKRKVAAPKATAAAHQPPKASEVPEIRLQRRQSYNRRAKASGGGRRSADADAKAMEDDDADTDNGGLIIEMDDADDSARKRKRRLAEVSRGRALSTGPISLRAAASSKSPAGRGAGKKSPDGIRVAAPMVGASLKRRADADEEDQDEDESADGEEETDGMAVDGAEKEDDEDAARLEAELENAFLSQDDDEDVAAANVQESDAESEEE